MAKKRSNGKGKSKNTTFKKKLKTSDVKTIPYVSSTIILKEDDKDFGFDNNYDDSFIKLEKFNLKPAPHTPWYTKLLNFFKKL